MYDSNILSEKLEDNREAAEWGIRQAELMRKGEEITRKLNEKYAPIIRERTAKAAETEKRSLQ